jgi:hypothetical protein
MNEQINSFEQLDDCFHAIATLIPAGSVAAPDVKPTVGGSSINRLLVFTP